MNQKKKLLLFTDWYAPGYKAGGPIRSCVNFVGHMKEDYDVYVFTSDRDLNSSEPYEGIEPDCWFSPDGKAQLYYCSPGRLSWGHIKEQLLMIQPDFIYLNSMFSPKFTILPLLISRLKGIRSKIVLSPRGMLRSS
ncbi:MAG TPA: hypothetical protein VI233_17985, partial [Puia sp.]